MEQALEKSWGNGAYPTEGRAVRSEVYRKKPGNLTQSRMTHSTNLLRRKEARKMGFPCTPTMDNYIGYGTDMKEPDSGNPKASELC